MEHMLTEEIHIMDWLKLKNVDFKWWNVNKSNKNYVANILDKYRIDQINAKSLYLQEIFNFYKQQNISLRNKTYIFNVMNNIHQTTNNRNEFIYSGKCNNCSSIYNTKTTDFESVQHASIILSRTSFKVFDFLFDFDKLQTINSNFIDFDFENNIYNVQLSQSLTNMTVSSTRLQHDVHNHNITVISSQPQEYISSKKMMIDTEKINLIIELNENIVTNKSRSLIHLYYILYNNTSSLKFYIQFKIFNHNILSKSIIRTSKTDLNETQKLLMDFKFSTVEILMYIFIINMTPLSNEIKISLSCTNSVLPKMNLLIKKYKIKRHEKHISNNQVRMINKKHQVRLYLSLHKVCKKKIQSVITNMKLLLGIHSVPIDIYSISRVKTTTIQNLEGTFYSLSYDNSEMKTSKDHLMRLSKLIKNKFHNCKLYNNNPVLYNPKQDNILNNCNSKCKNKENLESLRITKSLTIKMNLMFVPSFRERKPKYLQYIEQRIKNLNNFALKETQVKSLLVQYCKILHQSIGVSWDIKEDKRIFFKQLNDLKKNIKELLLTIRRKEKSGKRWRIALNGPKNGKTIHINYKCHLCGIPLSTHWQVIKNHFSNNHSENYELAIITPRLSRISPKNITISSISNEEKSKPDFIPSKGKEKAHWVLKKHFHESTPSNLGICVQQHSLPDSNLRCKKCNVYFNSVDVLREHIVLNHRIQGHYLICLECGENFLVSTSLQIHLKAFHNINDPISYMSQNKSYALNAINESGVQDRSTKFNQCYVCMAVFKNGAAVDKHLRIHGMAFLNRRRIETQKALNISKNKIGFRHQLEFF